MHGLSLLASAAILIASIAQAQEPPFQDDLGDLLEPGTLQDAPLQDAPLMDEPTADEPSPSFAEEAAPESLDDLEIEPESSEATDEPLATDEGDALFDEDFSADFGEGGYADWFGGDEMRPGRSSYSDWVLEGNSPWYASADATYYDRQSARPVTMTFIDTTIIVGNFIIPVFPAMQTARTLGFDFEPGMRVTLGRDLYRDIINRRHSFEFTFTGLNEWSSENTLYGERQTWDEFFNVVEVGTLQSPFPEFDGGFNVADEHRLSYESYMNNYEWNYRVRNRLGKDSKVLGSDGVWRRQFSPGITPSFLFGVRHLSIGEQFSFFSRGRYDDLIGGSEFPFSGNYYVSSRNNLVGVQTGGDMVWQADRWTIGFGGKVGLYLNVAEQSSNVVIDDPIFQPGGFSRSTHASTAHGAVVGDLNFSAAYRVTPRLLARLSYDFMWVSGLALAPEQIDFTLAGPPVTGVGGTTLFQGVTLGAEFTW